MLPCSCNEISNNHVERNCFDPPAVPFNGGQSNWNKAVFEGGKTPYMTEVTYSCALGRQLVKYLDNGTVFSESQVLQCQWDRTWLPEKARTTKFESIKSNIVTLLGR